MVGERVKAGAFARRGLPSAVFEAWTSSLRQAGEPVGRALAWAWVALPPMPDDTTDRPVAIGTRSRLSVPVIAGASTPPVAPAAPGPTDQSTAGSWQHLGWHRIEHGSWNGETRRLSWRLYGGRRGELLLPEPGRLPELFRERIAASVAVEERLDLGSGVLTVSGRRDLSRPDAPIEWQNSLGRGLNWRTPGLVELAEATRARLRTEYDRS